MFSQFGATSETLSKAFQIGTDAHLYDDPDDFNIAPLFDTGFDSEKCEPLKRLLALIAQGCDVSNFFPQRDLGDKNPLMRAWALRTMAGIRLHVIPPLVLVAVGNCARDPSVYVRKCAANALPKLHDLRLEENASSLEELVAILLQDHSPVVVGAAAAAFAYICPKRLSLTGRNYTKLCEKLPDIEEWGQIALIGILLWYVISKHGIAKESIMFTSDDGSGKDTDM